MTKQEIIQKIDNEIKKDLKQSEIVSIIREAIKGLSHTKIPNKRIETELKKVLPEYTIYFGKDYSQLHLKIWGNGIDYDGGIFFCVNESENTWESWLRECDREDLKDYAENLEYEKQYIEKLLELENQIATIQEKMETIKEGYIPKTANLRKSGCHWSHLSYFIQGCFPNIFK